MFSSISALAPSLVWTLLSGLVLTGGDLVLRSYLQTRWSWGFEMTFLIYAAGIFCMMMSFFEQNIALATVASIIVNAVIYLIVAYIFYGDTITVLQCVGMVLGLVALVILELA